MKGPHGFLLLLVFFSWILGGPHLVFLLGGAEKILGGGIGMGLAAG